jgi:hypothetical protein
MSPRIDLLDDGVADTLGSAGETRGLRILTNRKRRASTVKRFKSPADDQVANLFRSRWPFLWPFFWASSQAAG